MIVRSAIERIIAAKYPEEFKYHIVEIPDVPTVSLLPYLGECKRFLDEGRAVGGVLVHWFVTHNRRPPTYLTIDVQQ